MNIIIPLCGLGERFHKAGYKDAKPLIKIFNKHLLCYVLDNLSIQDDDRIYIIYHFRLEQFHFQDIIRSKYASHSHIHIEFIPINYQTTGAAETVYYGLNQILNKSTLLPPNKKCVLLDCDTFYTTDILTIARKQDANMVFYTIKNNEKPIYSYITLDCKDDSNNMKRIIDIKEKDKISSYANTGCYIFRNIYELLSGCQYILDNKITFNGEAYTSCVIHHMLKSNTFYGYELSNDTVFSLGTPLEMQSYISRTYAFLFDLDGTLVLTDDIYYKVWNTILSQYKIHITPEIYKNFIHGNSDKKVYASLLSHISAEDIDRISVLKDELFLSELNNSSSNITLIPFAIEFIKYVKQQGHLCSIVSNCNRRTAEIIIDKIGIKEYIDNIIIGAECDKPKPFPEPYLAAMKYYDILPEKTIIFEDSKTGILSARLANPRCLVGLTSNYSDDELIKLGVNIAVSDYGTKYQLSELLNLCIEYGFNRQTPASTHTKIKSYIKESINMNIKDIVINEAKLKGGYISDVIALDLILDNKCDNHNKNDISETSNNYDTRYVMPCVLKLENKNETKLSIMAKKLGLYERENYFYNSISRYVPITTSKFYGLIKDEELNTIGILMENLNKTGNYKLNLDLNVVDIDVSLQVIKELARFHSKYWGKDINKAFPELKKHNDTLFNPKWANFINKNWELFIANWKNMMSAKQLEILENIKNGFQQIQNNLSSGALTIIHGDVKSPNIFYNLDANYSPVFLDWQYVAIGKGIQDIVFFLIESFQLDKIQLYYDIFKNYYYQVLIQQGIQNYTHLEYEKDFQDAVCYFPFFVAVWFGTTPEDDLIDKNFPYFFIKKFLFFIEQIF